MFVITFTFSGAIFQKLSWRLTKVILATEEVITTTLKVTSTTTKNILATEEVNTAT